MPEPVIHRSQRFAKAARAERDRLERRRSRLAKKRQDLEHKVDQIGRQLEAVDREIGRLDEITSASPDLVRIHEAAEDEAKNLLRGGAIRTLAVPLLLREGVTGPIHYREWFERLCRVGYEIAGQRPDAVFLNQVVRSPLVKGTTKAGYYEIDLGAIERLRTKLGQQQSDLADFMRKTPTEGGETFDAYRERQHEMNIAMARTERELDEAEKAIHEASKAPEDAEVQAA